MKLTKVLCASALSITMLMGAGATLGTASPFNSFSITASAAQISTEGTGETGLGDATDQAKQTLTNYILYGMASGSTEDDTVGVRSNKYKMAEGGKMTYGELVDIDYESTGYVNPEKFAKLKGSEKSKFLGDMNNQANIAVDQEDGVYDDTKTDWLTNLQNLDGVGSQLMSTLLQNTKPDYVTANRIYEPFSGIVGTVIALGAILIMAALGIVMVLDLSYIGIPIFRNAVEGEGSGGQGGKPKWISYEATSAVQQAEGGGGAGGQDGGSKKTAVGIYFKKRVIMLVILGVCLLYLVQGQIFNLVSWILDLLSGFLGF